MYRNVIFTLIALVSLFCSVALGDVHLPALLSDNMVLQQGRSLVIWGWADPGEKIAVEIHGQYKSSVTSANKTWNIILDPLEAGGPYEMKVIGKNVLTIRNILVGEVWLGSGQSNMEQPIAGWDFKGDGVRVAPVNNAGREIALANYPSIRIFTVKKKESDHPLDDFEGKWEICIPGNAADFSATGYFFSRYLFQNLGIPIGFIHSSWGGSAIEPWIPSRAFVADTTLSQGYKYLLHTTDIKHWHESQQPHGTFYNGMIAPALSFVIRGIIWYQGEANTVAAHAYDHAFRTLIKEWRKSWNNEMPFFYVQIAPYDYSRHVGQGWPIVDAANLRQAQLSALKLPYTGMVVTTDIGDSTDIHPRNKQEIGRRLALLALGLTYHKDIEFSGPIYQSLQLEGNHIRINFKYAKSGLNSADGLPLNWFTVAGEDHKFFVANAVIKGDCVIVSSLFVNKPIAVRFAWADVAKPNLFNKAGLPASPFRTDNWPTPQEIRDMTK